jgi:hypothetical protein
MKNLKISNQLAPLIFLFFLTMGTIKAQDKPAESVADLTKKLSNPIASLISVPFQNNTDVGIGAYNGSRNTLNFQPVIPISLSPKLNMITRVVLPIVTQQDITAQGVKQTGLSDAVISAFFSPAEAKNGLTWGIGPAIFSFHSYRSIIRNRKTRSWTHRRNFETSQWLDLWSFGQSNMVNCWS